jgi:hypothetical protein
MANAFGAFSRAKLKRSRKKSEPSFSLPRLSKFSFPKLFLIFLIALINALINTSAFARAISESNPWWSDLPYDDTRPYLSHNSSGFLSQFSGSKAQGFLWTSESRPELELMNNQLGLRAINISKWYSPEGQFCFLLNTGIVQNDLRSEIGKVLFTTGTKLNEKNQLVFSSSWLQRHIDNIFSDFSGGQDNRVDQYMSGIEYRCNLRPIDLKSLAPGITASLGSMYYQTESKKLGQRELSLFSIESDIISLPFRYVAGYGLGVGGGSQIESLAGLELSWRNLRLDLHTGFRHKHYDEFLSYSSIASDAPTSSVQLSLFNFLGCQLATHYLWEPDQQILGGGIYKTINQKMSLIAQTDFIQSQDQMDDTKYFLGIQYNFGPEPKRTTRKHTRDDDSDDNDDWLKPVHGSNIEYLKVMRIAPSNSIKAKIGNEGIAVELEHHNPNKHKPEVKQKLVCMIPKTFSLDNKKKSWWTYLWGYEEKAGACPSRTCKEKYIVFEQATPKYRDYFRSKAEKLSPERQDFYRKGLGLGPDEEIIQIALTELPSEIQDCLNNICNNDKFSKKDQGKTCGKYCPEIKYTKICECDVCSCNFTFENCLDNCLTPLHKNDCITEGKEDEFKNNMKEEREERQKRYPYECEMKQS